MDKLNFRFKKYAIEMEKSPGEEHKYRFYAYPKLSDTKHTYPCVIKLQDHTGIYLRTGITDIYYGRVLVDVLSETEEPEDFKILKDKKEVEIMIIDSNEMKNNFFLNKN